MTKESLPVILLKGLCLLPFQEVKLDLNNNISKKVISVSKDYYDSNLLIVCPLNTLEESPDVSDLPLVGVVGKIKSKMELSSGSTRVIIEGIRRVEILEYAYYKKDHNILESYNKDIDKSNKQTSSA